MDESIRRQLTPGASVKITQQIAARDYTWTTATAGTIVFYEQRTTGSWFAHSKSDKLWLDRVKIRKADGEIMTLNLDEFSVIEIVSASAIGTGISAADAKADVADANAVQNRSAAEAGNSSHAKLVR